MKGRTMTHAATSAATTTQCPCHSDTTPEPMRLVRVTPNSDTLMSGSRLAGKSRISVPSAHASAASRLRPAERSTWFSQTGHNATLPLGTGGSSCTVPQCEHAMVIVFRPTMDAGPRPSTSVGVTVSATGRSNRSAAVTPIDRAEALVAEERVGDGGRSYDLLRVGLIDVATVAAGLRVTDGDGVQIEDSDGQGHIHRVQGLASGAFTRSQLADVVAARGGVQSGAIAQDQSQRQHGFGRDAIVVVAQPFAVDSRSGHAGAANHAAACVTDAREGGPLQCDAMRQPPLSGRTDSRCGVGNPEDVGSDVVVDPVKPPHAAIAVARLVAVAHEQAAAEDRLESIHVVSGELEIEIVERAVIAVVRLAGQTVGHGERRAAVGALIILLRRWRARVGVDIDVAVIAASEGAGQVHTGEHRRVVAAEHRRESLPIDQAVEARSGGDHRRSQLAPEPRSRAGAALQQQAGDPKQRLTQEVAADAAGDLVVEGGRGVLTRLLP